MSSDADLAIVLKFVDMATAGAAQWHAAEEKRIKQTGATQAKASKDAAKAHADAFRQMTLEAKASAKLEEQIAKDAAAAKKAALREVAAENRAVAKEQVNAIREAARAAAQTASERKNLEREVNATLKGLAKEQAQTVKEARAQEMATMKEAHKSAMALYADQQKGLAGYQKAVEGGAISVGKLGASMMGLSSAQSIVIAFVEHFDAIRRDAYDASKYIQSMRESVRELQALRDEMGHTGAGVAHVLEMTTKTLQKPGEVQAMESAGLGVGELGIGEGKDKAMTRAEFTEALTAAGKMQTMEGGDPGAYGQMIGQIILQAKQHMTPEEAEGRLNRLYEIQKPGGFKTMSQAMGQYAKLNPLVSNDIYSPEEAMGLASAFSVSSPEEAATKTEQYTRAILAGRLKARGMKVSKDVNLVTTDKYMKGLGISDQDSVMGMGDKIAADLKRQQEEATKKGKKFNAHDYLMTHGFGNQEERLAIMDYAGLKNSGRLEKIEAAQRAPLDNGAITRRFNERRSQDPLFQARAVETAESLAEAKQGAEEEPLVIAQRAAFARLKQQGKITGSFNEWRNKGTAGRMTDDYLFGGYHSQVNKETTAALAQEAQRVKADLPRLRSGANPFGEDYNRELARNVQKAGGDVSAGVAEDLKTASKEFHEAVREFKAKPLAAPGGRPPLGVPAPHPGAPFVQRR